MQTFDKGREEAAIRAVEKAYDTAWHNGNIQGLMECLTDSISVVNPFGQSAFGKNEFQKMLIEFINGPGKDTEHTSTILSVNFITDNVAIVDGKAIINDPNINAYSNKSSLTHYFSDVLVKQNETWVISAIRAYTFIAEKPSVK